MAVVPQHQIRAAYDEHTVRIYQAYSDEIASAALSNGTFTAPPFKMERMTWIKPSFLWMMYRAGWGYKDPGQRRILAIDISRDGFEWALRLGRPTRISLPLEAKSGNGPDSSPPVLVQWDPERDIQLQPKPYRTIQIGLRGEGLRLYVHEWIRKITDVTNLAHSIAALVEDRRTNEAELLVPVERPYVMRAH